MWLASAAVVVAVATAAAAGGGTALAAADACPDPNPPNELLLADGSDQTAQLGTQFAQPLQVQLANSNGCPLAGDLAGINVEFEAPASGPSGIFSGSGSARAAVGTDAQGAATAPAFTANFATGSYTVDAVSAYGSVGLSLGNTASGLPAAITASGGSARQATVAGGFAQPLQARVTDADGNPVQGAMVSFAIGSASNGAGAGFLGGGAQASATTGADGIATSPALLANTTAGDFTATAALDGTPDVASYALRSVAARPATIAVGAASGESTLTRTRFRVPLAVTVTDRYGNPVVGATVVFTAPRRGPSGRFKKKHHSMRVVRVRTNSNGIAVAPRFTANSIAGGYLVTARIRRTSARGTFALVNQARG